MLPVKLKSKCLNQIDQALSIIGAQIRISVIAQDKIVEDHLASAELISLVNELDGIRCTFLQFRQLAPNDSKMAVIAINGYGDTYLVEHQAEGSDDAWMARAYFHLNQVVEEYQGSWSALRKELDLHEDVIRIQKTARPGALANTTAGNGTCQPHMDSSLTS